MGVAYLYGQIGVQVSIPSGLSYLRRAADLASIAYPQPSFMWALILMGLFPGVSGLESALRAYVPPGSTLQQEGKKYLEQAADYNYGPALYQIGHFYEWSTHPLYNANPMRSLQYYQKASKHGIAEAYMGMSRWFLCGAKGSGGFAEDHVKARKCASRAASAKLSMAQFAMGYFNEAGIAGLVDHDEARRWYYQV